MSPFYNGNNPRVYFFSRYNSIHIILWIFGLRSIEAKADNNNKSIYREQSRYCFLCKQLTVFNTPCVFFFLIWINDASITRPNRLVRCVRATLSGYFDTTPLSKSRMHKTFGLQMYKMWIRIVEYFILYKYTSVCHSRVDFADPSLTLGCALTNGFTLF